MAETYENYVVSKLRATEMKMAGLEKINTLTTRQLSDVTKKYNLLVYILRTNHSLNCNADGDKYLSFHNIYEKYNPEEYNALMNIIEKEE